MCTASLNKSGTPVNSIYFITISITSIDGVFTFMIATQDGIGFAKDRFAMKPLVVIDQAGDLVYMGNAGFDLLV